MNRQHLSIIAIVVLILGAVAYHVYADWGLVTIHAHQMPLGKVIASMERQGHAKIQTDMPQDTIMVTMDVVKVPLVDALEKLSVVTNSRWRFLYFAAGDKATLKKGEDAWFNGQAHDDWTMVSFPFGNQAIQLDDGDPPVFDPRQDTYTPKAAAPAPIQAYFLEAAQLTNAGFAFPTAWTPSVSSLPAGGAVEKVIPKLISKAGGHEDQIFFLSLNGGGGGRGQGGPGGPGGGPMAGFDPALFEQRVQNEIDRLPPEEKTEAQNNFDAEKAFRASLATMTDDQRRDAFMARMQDPAFQAAMQNRQDSRESAMGHDQRMQRFQNMVNRKLSITGKM